jgi:predicted polyphosphate/ATP-dependent NAD kinase
MFTSFLLTLGPLTVRPTLALPESCARMSPVMAKKFLRLVVNGKVANSEALRTAVAQQRGLGHRVEVYVTWERGDARRFSSQPEEPDMVVAVGGDGTVNEVLHGLMTLPTETRPALAMIPLGTANDFARGCGIPLDPNQALALCVTCLFSTLVEEGDLSI